MLFTIDVQTTDTKPLPPPLACAATMYMYLSCIYTIYVCNRECGKEEGIYMVYANPVVDKQLIIECRCGISL